MDKPPKESGDSWEEQTLRLLREVFPNESIERQVKFPELPRAIVDFYIPCVKENRWHLISWSEATRSVHVL